MLFACFTLRQLSNLGQGPVSVGLAQFLANSVTGRNGLQLPEGSANLVECTGAPAQKRFEASLDVRDEHRATFLLNLRGFGILGWDMNYFATQSAILFWKYLGDRHTALDVDPYRSRINRVAELCSRAFRNGKVTILNQESLARQAAKMALES